jgi:hypothetical protein
MAKYYDKWTLALGCPVWDCNAAPGELCRSDRLGGYHLKRPHGLRAYYGKLQRLKAEKAALDDGLSDLDS